MASYDPKTVKPRRDWVLVLMEERRDFLADVGLYIAPQETGAEKVTEGTGIIVRVGDGDKNKLLGLDPGMRICMRSYFKHANVVPTDEEWPSGKPKEYFLMATDDIMAIAPHGTDVGVFSRPAMSAVDAVDAEGNVRMK